MVPATPPAKIRGDVVSDYSSILFARPSFAEGVGRLHDFGNTLTQYNTSENGAAADLTALQADGLALGEDMRTAMTGAGSVKQISAKK
jgi:hypothetical protein